MKLIPTLAALTAGALLPLTACGALPDEATPNRTPVEHVAAWQAYYDATHDLPPRPAVDHVARWQAYYDATHP